MGGAPGWHPDPHAPHAGVLRWWDGHRWTQHCTGPPRDPLEGPRALDDATVEHLIEGLVAHQKRTARTSSDVAGYGYYDPEQIESDTSLIVRELARLLPVDEPPLDLRRPGPGTLLALSARRLLVLVKPRRDEGGVDVSTVPYERLDLRTSRGGVNVHGDGPRVVVGVAAGEYRWISEFLAGPRAPRGLLAEVLARPRRVPDAWAPDWYPDPMGQFAERFWDGHRWTDDGIGTPPGPLVKEPPTGPPALDDETAAHLLEGLVGQRMRRQPWIDEAAAWDTGPSEETGRPFELRMSRAVVEMQRLFPMDDPPLDLHHDFNRLLVVSVRRVVVLGSDRDPPVVDAELHERVQIRKAGVLRMDPTVVRQADGMVLNLSGPARRWLQGFLAGPRVLQGSLKDLLDRPRRPLDAARPGWYPDPTGRYHKRFWDGITWAPQVTQWSGKYATPAKDDPLP